MGNEAGKLVREVTRPVRDVAEGVPVVGHSAAKVLRETARIVDQGTTPVQEPIKGLVNDVTGARKRENTRLDAEKERLINEAKNRVAAQRVGNEGNIQAIMAEQINVLRAEIAQAERENVGIGAEGEGAERIPNPIFAFEECSLGRTEELALILGLAQPN